NLHIGRRPIDPAGDRFTFGGLIDEASVYNRALSQSEIQSIYNAGSAGKCSSNAPPVSAAPVITSITPSSGLAGSPVTITGSNFAATAAGDIVYFGAVQAVVTSASTSNLTVTVPTGATYGPISDTVQGLTADSSYPFLPTFPGATPLGSTSLSNSFNLNLAGKEPFGLLVGDLDGDGKPDVVVFNAQDATVWVYRNISSNGMLTAASFAAPVILTSAPPINIAGGVPTLADVDGDGRLDIVVPNFDAGTVSVFQNLSTPGSLTSGSFAPRMDYAVGTQPLSVVVSDLDGDGRPDIIAANFGSSTVSVLKNLSTGGLLKSNSFASPITLNTPSSPSQVAAADIDGDGKIDIVTVNYGGAANAVSIFRNTSSGGNISFASRVDLSAAAGQDEALAVADMDGDGKLDLIVSCDAGPGFSVFRNIGSPGSITAGSFAAPANFFSAGGLIHRGGIALGDIDGDGRPDVAVVDQDSGNLFLYRNLSSPGSFDGARSLELPVTFPSGYNSAMVAIDDLNGDGQPDIVIANTYGNNLTIWQNASAVQTVTNPPPPSCTPAASGMAAWWRAEDNADDSINGNNGTINGGVSYSPGEVGQAFNFDGTSGYISVPASPSLNIGTGSGITIECWIQPNYLGPSYAQGRPIVEYDTPSAAGVHFWFEQGYTLYANVIDTSGVYHTISTAPGTIVTNALQHVAVTYDKSSGNCFLYINGAQAASANFGNITPQTTYPLYIGDRAANGLPGTGSLYNGLLDELTLYGRALSPSEIAAIYNAGSGGKCLTPMPPMITAQPTDETVTVGGTATFSVTASGSSTLTYQWYNASGSIDGATGATLTLSNVQLSAAGSYYVTVSNPYGSTNSASAMLTVTNPSPPSCTPPPSGLVGWWRAEGNALDSIGGNNGVITGAVSFASGEVGQAFLFNDTNEDIIIPASSNLDVGLGVGLTLEAWINPQNVTNYNPIFEWNPGDGTNYWGVGMFVLSGSVYNSSPVPGTLYANVQGVGDVWHQLWSVPGTVTNGGFQHVALTYDKASGVATLYCNGAIVAQQNFGSFTPKTIANLHIGRRPTDPAGDRFTFGGLIDEASVYNRALSQSEIQSIYNSGSAGKCSSNAPPVSAAPVITSITPSSGLAGSPVTITGSNFAATAAGDIVYFGAVQAAVTTGNTSSLTAIAPTNATFGPISVTVGGLTGYSEPFYLPDFKGAGPLTN
ncbi:MAG TPA: FG-GAP-like repeat-containing protein, partial [Verrucomicrobiae bacterium]|nr:FG-GAP-like repeat-containing protein [Verrucomicrobiae bacterium]